MAESNLIRPASAPVVTPNVRAPLYNFPEVASEYERHLKQQELLRQAVNVLTSETGFQATEDTRQLLRQTGMVNLFVFLRFICGYANAFKRLTEDLHLDMCNFYQIVSRPGMKAAGFTFRGAFKSSVWTYGGSSWDIARDPDHEEVLASNIIERAQEFNQYIQEIFTDNELVMWLYPEWVPESTHGAHWNSKETRVACKRTSRPNIRLVAVGGSIQGVHAPRFKVDDLIGEHMLDSQRMLGADNEKASNWFRAAVRNIPRPVKTSSIFLCGTRYGPGDAYTHQWADIKKFYGYTQAEPFEERPDGEWTVYYRAVREDHGDGNGDQPTFPEEFTNKYLDKIQQEDPWTYWTQLMNMSTYSGLSEMIDYQVRDCKLDVDRNGRYIVSYFDYELGEECVEALDDMDVVAGLDPAASEKRKSIRTSKSAYVVMARNWKDYRFFLHVKSAFAPITQVFDWLFDGYRKFRGYMRTSNVEMQGPFKVLRPIIREEERRRKELVNLRGVAARGDKDGRIRAHLQPLFDRGVVYAVETAQPQITGEMMVFPDGHQKDVLDAMAIAEAASYKPESPDDYDEDDVQAMEADQSRSVVTGY
jgi:hypothetical protein